MITVNGEILKEEYFADGTPKMMNMPFVHPGTTIVDFTWCFDNNSELMFLYMASLYYREKNPSCKQALRMPYIPNARMDRTKNDEECFTLKYMVQLLNSLNFNYVEVLDSHSDVSTALINNVRQMDIGDIIQSAIKESGAYTFIYPDTTAEKRYAELVGNSGSVGYKKRQWGTNKIIGYELKRYDRQDDVFLPTEDILMIDDICSYGGTFDKTRDAIIEKRAIADVKIKSINLYVTHCEKNIFKGKLFQEKLFIEEPFKLYTTDSILKPEDVPDEFKERVFFVKKFRKGI